MGSGKRKKLDKWRRERDSNPRYHLWQYTRFPVALLRPTRTSLRNHSPSRANLVYDNKIACNNVFYLNINITVFWRKRQGQNEGNQHTRLTFPFCHGCCFKINIGGTHPPNTQNLAIHPGAQRGVFGLNCFKSPAKDGETRLAENCIIQSRQKIIDFSLRGVYMLLSILQKRIGQVKTTFPGRYYYYYYYPPVCLEAVVS